jgi:dTDP-4-dehydrorhamnose 3,5-epimerase
VNFRRLPTELGGVVLIEPTVHGDERGFFVETFRANEMRRLGIEVEFVQENHSRSGARILRGIHLQRGQAKLVRCARGRIFDVAVDLRPDSPTYRRWEGYELDDADHRQLFIPDGFGHGFCVLSDTADVLYRVSSYYDPELERGIAWDDPEIAVDWPVREPVLSDRDRSAPSLSELAAAGSGLGSG